MATPTSNPQPALTPEKQDAYWRRTRRLMFTILALWFVFSFGVHFFAIPLNKVVIAGFPLGFYMAAQGSLIVFVILIFWFAAKQNSIDEELGVGEE